MSLARARRLCFSLCFAWTILLVCPGPVRAGDDGKVKIAVVAILASERHTQIDPKLVELARELQKRGPQWTGFHIARIACKRVPVGSSYQFTLIDDLVATVGVPRGKDADSRFTLHVKPPQMGEIDYSTACGKFFPIITPYNTKAGEHLILAIMVKECSR